MRVTRIPDDVGHPEGIHEVDQFVDLGAVAAVGEAGRVTLHFFGAELYAQTCILLEPRDEVPDRGFLAGRGIVFRNGHIGGIRVHGDITEIQKMRRINGLCHHGVKAGPVFFGLVAPRETERHVTLAELAAAFCRGLGRALQLLFVAVCIEFHVGEREIEDAEAVGEGDSIA